MTAKLPVTVVIPTKNEAVALPLCLAQLGRFDRIVVLDSCSTDNTAELAKSANAEVINFKWNGEFPKKRNWFLRNHAPTTPWVLFLDADEIVNERFCDALAQLLPSTPHSGMWLNYTNWFLGQRLKHGERNRKLALFRPSAGEFERIENGDAMGLDMEIHEHPQLAGTTGEIVPPIDHRDDKGIQHWLTKHNAYSSWEARRLADFRSGRLLSHLTPRQLRKYRTLGRWWLPCAYFFQTYVLKGGFLDGYAGFVYAKLKSQYFGHVGLKLRAHMRTQDAPTLSR